MKVYLKNMKKKDFLKIIILVGVGFLLLFGGILSWNLYFSKYQIFHQQEKAFLEAVTRFYSLNPQYLPKLKETREMTLQDLYDGNHITDLYIPKTKKLCDSNSWVRVYQNEDGEYEYTTYLKCGKFESKVDHTGPEITLNGSIQSIVPIGTTYQELGVKSVVDQEDGKIDSEKVIIDSSKVDTSKVGSYPVTYTVYDQMYNKTVVTRNVIVAYNLTEIVRNATDDTNYYKGGSANNFLLFSGMLWRIVKVNEDGSIKMISEEAITNLRADYDHYQNSNVDEWLQNVFYPALHNPDNYLINSTYCVGNIQSMTDYGDECSETITSKIGLLNISDYVNTFQGEDSSIFATSFLLSHKIGNNYADAGIGADTTGSGVPTGILAPIRPVITLRSDLYLLTGDGSLNNPYKLDDYQYGNANDTINTRLIGEYLTYSGLTFRIIGVDSNQNVKVIMAYPWTVQPNNQLVQVDVSQFENTKFKVSDSQSIAYFLNHDYLDYINTNAIVDTEYEIPTNTIGKKYYEYETEKVTAKILLPVSYELFSASGNQSINRTSSFLYLDQSSNEELLYMVNGVNGKMFELNKNEFNLYSIRAVLTLKGTLKITSGNGTVNKPYLVK